MNHERWKAAADLYFQALEAPDARAFLDDACKGDPELRQEVELLLKQDHDTVHLFDRQACIDDLEAAQDRQLLAPGSTLGQYQILQLLGSGGSSDVYKAFDSRLERNVALKVFANATLTADFRARFAREAKVAASLNHPNIATVYDVGEAGRHWYIAMEYVDGVALREKFNDSTCSLSERLDYLGQAAGALARAHATGLVHCDLKPENIILTGDGLVKVLDFGLARQVQAGAVEQPRAGIEGTVGYMSPEQAARQPISAHSDVFAFGCMLFEAAANRLPFWSPSVTGALENLRHADPPRLSAFAQKLPAGLQELVDDCLAKDPAARLRSMQDVSVRLHAIAHKKSRTGGRLAWGMAALLAVSAAFGYWQWRNQSPAASVAVIPFVNARSTPEGIALGGGNQRRSHQRAGPVA